jgi:hypothetical protein
MLELQSAESGSDFYFRRTGDAGRDSRDPGQADSIRDIQVLCQMNRGSIRGRELNTVLQIALNPVRPGEPRR